MRGLDPKVVSTPDTPEQGWKTGSPNMLPDEPQLWPKGQGGD